MQNRNRTLITTFEQQSIIATCINDFYRLTYNTFMKNFTHKKRNGLALWLLTLMCLASVNVWGQETKTVTFDFSTVEGINDMGFTPPESGKGVNITTPFIYQGITFSCTKGSEYTRIWNSNGKYELRCYKNGSISFEAPTDGNITNIVFTGTASFNEGKSWTGKEKKVTFNANGSCKIQNITVTYEEGATTQCSAPTFSPASGTSFANTLTVIASTTTEGGKIVYTTDPEATLDANSTEFPSEGLTIDATTTIRAITVDPNGTLENSGEVSVTYTKINLTKSVYKKITSTDEISAGATYVIINESNNIALGFIDEDGYGKIVNTYLQDGFARFDTENNNENPYEIVLSEGTDGNYILETVQGKIGYESSTSFAINKNTNWNISFTRDGNASITNIEGNREIRYNSNTNDFRLYTSNSGTLKVQLYKKVAFNITDAGFATYYTDKAFVMPENVQGGIVTKANKETNQLTISYNYQPGTVVPAKTPIVLKGEKGDYTVNYTTSEETAPAGNMLYGAENVDAEGKTFVEGTNVKYYKLALGNDGKCGFYWGATDGAAFEYTANRAFLAIDITDASQAPTSFSLDGDGSTTAINGIMNGNDDSQKIYTVTGVYAGKSLNNLPKGIYIVGGKKVAVK